MVQGDALGPESEGSTARWICDKGVEQHFRREKIENFIQEFPAGDICSAASHLMNSSNQPSAFHLEFGFATEFLQKHAGRTTSTGALNLTWIHRIDWVGKDLRDHQVQPLVQLQSID
ncbi:uncharacterized protein LOC110358960 isoform X2 [Columba livia]|uniref:uncharacterized protein LOC110358960 isoform X2 n=1 Tax=Columba livia TaxID=8932 RepID=UPI0031BB20A7